MPIPSTDGSTTRPLLRDQVQDMIRDAILDGTLRPGERLRDDDLIAWTGVSRTPIREALTILATEGLIEMSPNRFTRVALPAREDVLDALRTLGILIGGVVRVTVPTLSAGQVEQSTVRVGGILDQLRAGGTRAISTTIGDSYQTWLDLCPNAALADVCQRAVQGLAFTFRVDDIETLIPCEHIETHLTAFRDALLAGDAVGAGTEVERAHMLTTAAR